jgi:WD40 repeat protein
MGLLKPPLNRAQRLSYLDICMKAKELLNEYRNGRRDFRTIDLSGIDLTWAVLSDADFKGSNLQGAILTGATLHRVDFGGGVNLTFADLSRAEMVGADLTGVNFEGANLEGVNLSGVRFDETTRFPKGFQPPIPLSEIGSNSGSLQNLSPDDAKTGEDAIAARQPNLAAKQALRDPVQSRELRQANTNPINVEWVDVDSSPQTVSTSASLASHRSNWILKQTLTVHKKPVRALAVSADGKWLASGSEDRTVVLRNLQTGQHEFCFQGQSQDVTSVAFSADSKIIASGCFDQKVTAWTLDNKHLLRTFMQPRTSVSHNGPVYALGFTASGNRLISAGADRSINIWDVKTGRLTRTLHGHSEAVTSIALSPDEKTLVSGSVDRTIGVWDLEIGKLRHTLSGHSAWVCAIAIGSDGEKIASVSTDGTLMVWNLHTGLAIYSKAAHANGTISIALSPDREFMASASSDRTVKLWHLATGQLLQTLDGCDPVTFTPDGKTLITGGDGASMKLWHQAP